jgi:hypothetical protein
MNQAIDRIKKTRQYLIKMLEDLPIESINKVPEGFNNNIIWNVGHLIAAQQGICYVRAGLSLVVNEKYFLLYKPGTKPEKDVDQSELEEMKVVLLDSLDKLENDYERRLFINYPPWTTRYGVELENIDTALEFLMFHEGLHSGTIMALKRLVHDNVADKPGLK